MRPLRTSVTIFDLDLHAPILTFQKAPNFFTSFTGYPNVSNFLTKSTYDLLYRLHPVDLWLPRYLIFLLKN